MNTEHIYTVKNVKTFEGMEGIGFNASLYQGGKKIAFVIDDATGGDLQIQWHDKTAKTALLEYINTLPDCDIDGTGEHLVSMSVDIFISELVNQHMERQQKRRWCKNATVFRVKGDRQGEYRKVPVPYSSAVKAKLIEEYGDDLEEIVNETIG